MTASVLTSAEAIASRELEVTLIEEWRTRSLDRKSEIPCSVS
jgi:hypothetical protein